MPYAKPERDRQAVYGSRFYTILMHCDFGSHMEEVVAWEIVKEKQDIFPELTVKRVIFINQNRRIAEYAVCENCGEEFFDNIILVRGGDGQHICNTCGIRYWPHERRA